MMTMWAEMCGRFSYQEKQDEGRPRIRYLDVVKEDMQEVGARDD